MNTIQKPATTVAPAAQTHGQALVETPVSAELAREVARWSLPAAPPAGAGPGTRRTPDGNVRFDLD